MIGRRLVAAAAVGGLLCGAAAGPVRADGICVITGKVVFKGDPAKHKRKVIDTGKDPNCKMSKKKIGTDTVIINKKTDPPTVRNVLVSIKEGLGDTHFAVPVQPQTLTQAGCQYKPHVLGVMKGQELKILNGDDTNHNIHFLPKVNEEHNFTQPKKDLETGRTLTLRPEAPFKVKCDVHPWMGAYIGVFKHPFFDVTNPEGTFKLKGMPAGKYTLEAWHEKFGTLTAEVEVSDGETAYADFTYEVD